MSIWDKLLLGVMIYLALAAWVRVWEEHRWRTSLTALELRLPVDVDAEQAGRWIGTLAGMMDSPWWWCRIPRWWPLGMARWPVTLEVVATDRGVQRVLVVPSVMVGEVLGSLAAVMPGVRADELPTYVGSQSPRWRMVKELRLSGTRQLLDTRRAADTSRHVTSLRPCNP